MKEEARVGQLLKRTRHTFQEDSPKCGEIFRILKISENGNRVDLLSTSREFSWTSDFKYIDEFWEPYHQEIELPKGGDWE